MAKYRDCSYEQSRLLPASLKNQIQPGTIEYTINYLVDHEIDLSVFDEQYKNDETGAPAIDPVLIININRTFRYGMPAVELYDATRSAWIVGEKRNNAEHALANYQGIVQEVYEIKGWFPANSTLNSRKIDEAESTDRWEFVGKIAASGIRSKYRFKDISKYLGTQNPIRYVNCD